MEISTRLTATENKTTETADTVLMLPNIQTEEEVSLANLEKTQHNTICFMNQNECEQEGATMLKYVAQQ